MSTSPSGSRTRALMLLPEKRAMFIASSPWENITSILPSFGTPKTSSSSNNGSSFPSLPSFPSSSSSSGSGSGSGSGKRRSEIDEYLQDPVTVGVLSAVAALGVVGGGRYAYRRYWKRIRNVNDITGNMLDQKRWIRGVVTSVGDGDNFRVYHTPGPFYRFPLKFRSVPTTAKELKDETLHIRIAAVDAPENAHFGKPAQPFAKESWDWMKELLTGKTVRCQLVRKDQYGRVVGVPYLPRLILRDKAIPIMMLKEGMGVVYESGGAEYGPWSPEYLKKLEAEARRAKKGMWGVKGKFEHPADYKKRMKIIEEGEVAEETGAKRSRKSQGGLFGFLGRIFGRS